MVSEYPSSRNCIVYYNSAPSQPNCGGVTENISYSCTDGVTGQQNIAGEPMFVDLESGNLRLRENSPCIGAGDPLTESVTRDRDNRPRNPAGQTDIGAYGYFGANIGEFIGWLEISGLPTDGSGDTSDSDFDGSDNYEEWRSGTSPSNAEDVLKMLPPQLSTRGISIEWRSVAGKSYALMEIHLSATSGLPRETHIATNVVATGNITSYLVAVGTNGSAQAFRVKVE